MDVNTKWKGSKLKLKIARHMGCKTTQFRCTTKGKEPDEDGALTQWPLRREDKVTVLLRGLGGRRNNRSPPNKAKRQQRDKKK